MEQAVVAARENIETLTALLDARFVAGDRPLYERFVEARRKLCAGAHDTLERGLRQRYDELRRQEPWQLQEPDLKEGRGGLRCIQSLHWLEAVRALSRDEEPPPLPPRIEAAHATLLATRHALHAQTERPHERYVRELAVATTRWLGVDRTNWERGVFEAMRTADAAIAEQFSERPVTSLFARLRSRFAANTDEAPTPLPHGADPDLEPLLTALRGAGPNGLDPMPPAPWLERLLPEWDVLRALPHIAPFHLHPVDVHVWRTVSEVTHAVRDDEDDSGTVEAARDLDEVELLLAALLHDIGKGHEGDHSAVGAVIAERFAARAALDAEVGRRLSLATELHLLLPVVATRRDIADPRVIRETADRIGDARMLQLLYVLSVADARASGPDVWNPWKAQLIRTLYLRVADVLSAEAPDAATALSALRERAVVELAEEHARDEVVAHLDRLAPNYVLGTAPEVIGQHLEMVREAAQNERRTAVRLDPLTGVDRLTVVTQDRPGILSLVAGTLAVHNANVLGGTAFTRADGIAIEVMHVNDALGHDIDERRWARILEAIPSALAGEFPVDERLAETRAAYHAAPRIQMETTVLVDNNDSERYSIIEVTTADRLGLLYAITNALHDLSLDIHLAKVDTIGAEVVDAFYVLRENGRRVEDTDEIERIVRRVRAAVTALDEGDADPSSVGGGGNADPSPTGGGGQSDPSPANGGG